MPRIDSPFPRKPINWHHIYGGVALTSLATLTLELSLTRLFSVVFHYHFAFLSISIALFGLGTGGVLSYVIQARPGKVFSKLALLSTLNGIAVPCALVLLLTRRGEFSFFTLALIYFVTALPFVLAGAVLAMAIAETIERVDRVYFFDLLGAAAGCLALVPFLNYLGGPNTILAAGVLFTAAGAIWFHLEGRIQGRAAAVLLGLVLTSLVVINFRRPLIEVTYAKGAKLPPEMFSRWNPISRVGLLEKERLIVIDGDASTGIPSYDFSRLTAAQRQDLLSSSPALAYRLRPGAKTLVIGSGGGYDLARALASGSTDVTAVEINSIIADTIMRERFADLSQRLYFRPELRVFVEDGRSFVRRSIEKYQVLQATLVDTWASTAAGAFALTENNLYTSDAFHDYLSHLTGDGLLAFTRWGFEPPRESLRLLSLAREALGRLGETAIGRHVVVARENTALIDKWGATDTVIITRKPMADSERAHVEQAIRLAKLEPVYTPWSQPGSSTFADYLHSGDPRAFHDKYRYDVTPVDDNRPFFFYTVQPRDLVGFLTSAYRGSADHKINLAVPLLFGLVGVSILATLITLALPPLALGTRLPNEPGLRRFLLYFVCIGAGYILIQVALIQKFVLFLGHPTRALTVCVFSMLISSGIGSYFSRRHIDGSKDRWMRVLAAAAVSVVVLAFLAGPVTRLGVGLPLWLKAPIAVLLIAPAGFLMGIPFPTGLSWLERRHKPSVRWAWSLNAASSVMGSALSMFLALYLGLMQTLIIGALFYAAAWMIVRREPNTGMLTQSATAD